ncbi:hypothetical protein BST43_16020 [Mycobacteroides saopaulense]|uniref:Uncharacterized protein n=1 Tax=Mycobacteroides saopaulense TaxID=1578165 RepID=A0A1X0IZ95_9MYCO|nr:hypothetical protein [Mycobacteroides saopaulense]ORB54548.1 hypothetical protein BST43_16020 [Mycobacteroides saopaulense]
MSASVSDWGGLEALRVSILAGSLPIVIFRLWRAIRYPTSVPVLVVTALGTFAWIWILVFASWVWAALPPLVRAVSMGGWPAISVAACLQVFVVGIRNDASPSRVRRSIQVTSMVAILALVVNTVLASRSPVLMSGGDVYALIEDLYAGSDTAAVAASVVSSVYVIFVIIQLAWFGSRHADRTPIGVGLGLMAAASICQFIASFYGGIWRPLTRGGGVLGVTHDLWVQTVAGCLAVVLMFMGFVWPPMTLYMQARRDLRRLWPLHNSLGNVFPGLFPPQHPQIRLSDLVFESTTHIQDGLTLLAQTRGLPLSTGAEIPSDKAERADSVTDWLIGQEVPGFSAEWLHAPVGMDDETWVLAIADAYRERQDGLEAPASLSGMPSTLRK